MLALAVTLLIRWILIRFNVDDHLWLRTASYVGLFIMFSISLWLLFFRT